MIGSYRGPVFPISDLGHSNACVSFFFREVFFRLRAWKEINKLFTGLGSDHIVKNGDLGHSFSLYRSPSRQTTYIIIQHCFVEQK